MRWSLVLKEFDLVIQHVRGKECSYRCSFKVVSVLILGYVCRLYVVVELWGCFGATYV